MIKMVIKMKYDVIIVGAGPAGLFTAYELITKNDKLKIAMIDKGFRVKKRVTGIYRKRQGVKICEFRQ